MGRETPDLTPANEGEQAIVYTVTLNDYKGTTKTVTVKNRRWHIISWPANEDGYYDVVIITNSADGFRRRYGVHRLMATPPCVPGTSAVPRHHARPKIVFPLLRRLLRHSPSMWAGRLRPGAEALWGRHDG